jgi:hypothetical protein
MENYDDDVMTMAFGRLQEMFENEKSEILKQNEDTEFDKILFAMDYEWLADIQTYMEVKGLNHEFPEMYNELCNIMDELAYQCIAYGSNVIPDCFDSDEYDEYYERAQKLFV